MGDTRIRIEGRNFLINDRPVYSDIPGSNPRSHGLLWNQRMIQGVFDDAGNRDRYNQLTMEKFDPELHTDALIAALPEWYAYGLRAITVGYQGGWPVSMSGAEVLNNNPFGATGEALDPAYAARMDRIIRACDALGMVVIVNMLYWAQAKDFKDGRAVRSAVTVAANFLRDQGYTNVMVDVANEYDISLFADHPIVNTHEGISALIDLVRAESGGLPTASSGGGGSYNRQVAEASDYVLLHGNGLTRGQYADLLRKVTAEMPDKPILCNEDCPCCTRVDVALAYGTSWGYYNNYTKQIPPAPWGVTAGEDLFFARRVARAVGIPVEPLAEGDQYVLQGLDKREAYGAGLHTMRLAAEYPERVDFVEFFRNGERIDISYDEPFFCHTICTWLANAFAPKPGEVYSAKVHLVDGKVIEKSATI